jgi:hypothetical protein
VQSWKFDAEDDTRTAEELAIEVTEAAKEDEGAARYRITAYDDEDKAIGRTTFEPPRDPRDDSRSSRKEEKGIEKMVSNMARQQDRMFRFTVDKLASRLDRSEEAQDRLREESRELEKERIEQFKVMQDLLNEKTEREAYQVREKRRDEIIGVFTALLPRVLGGLLPAVGGGDATGPGDIMIAKVLNDLTEEELIGVIKSLSPANQMKFGELYRHAREVEKKLDGGKVETDKESN